MPTKTPKNDRIPAYRPRKNYDQAIVTLRDAVTKRVRDYWLGPYGSPESRQLYRRLIAEWETRGRRLPDPDFGREPSAVADGPTVNQILVEYWAWAQSYYSRSHLGVLKPILRLLRRFFGMTAASAFGPKGLRLLRDEMVRGDAASDPPRKPWARKSVNMAIQRVRHIFRWAVAREMLPASVYQAVSTLEPLRRGRSIARETERIGPVPQWLLEGTLPHLSRPVRALVELQLLTGARPGELLGLRTCDINMDPKLDAASARANVEHAEGDTKKVWTYRPLEHKNAHRERDRLIIFGPKAQEILRPFLLERPLDAYLFSPSEADAEHREARRKARKTPIQYGHSTGTNRKESPIRKPGLRFTTASYNRSVWYACRRAFPLPPQLARTGGETRAEWEARLTDEQKSEIRQWWKTRHWHVNQLRHAAATTLRREFGLEAAQLALGHSSAQVTDSVYAERDATKVADIMWRIG